jgi:hypothetical protein
MQSVRHSLRGAAAFILLFVLAASVGCGRKATTQVPAPATPVPATQPAPAAAQAPASPASASDQGDPAFLASLEQVAQSRVHYKFVLDESTREYHWWNCTIAASKGSAVVPTTMSREQITAAGYQPCPVCRPDMDAPPAPPQQPAAPQQPPRLGPPPAKKLETPIEVGSPQKPRQREPRATESSAEEGFPKAIRPPTRPPTSGVNSSPPAPATPAALSGAPSVFPQNQSARQVPGPARGN